MSAVRRHSLDACGDPLPLHRRPRGRVATARLASPAVARPREGIAGFAATAGERSSRLVQSWSRSLNARDRGSPAAAFPSEGGRLVLAPQGNAAPGTPV